MMTNQMIAWMVAVTFREVGEDNVSNCIVERNKMLDISYPTAVQLQHAPYEINTHTEFTVAPCGSQVPLSILRD